MKQNCPNRMVSFRLTLAAALCCAGGLAHGATIIPLPTLGGSAMTPKAQNGAGQIVGYSFLSGDTAQHAFRYGAGVSLDLGTLGGSISLGSGINAAGLVVGDAALPDDLVSHAFLFNGSALVDLGTLGGSISSARTINNAGQVAGESHTTGDLEAHAFLYSGGTMIDLGTLGGSASTSLAINNAGHVMGNSLLPGDYSYQAFVFKDGAMTALGTLGGSDSYALAINDAGQVAGDSYTAAGRYHAFRWQNGTMLDLGTLGGTYSTAVTLNEAGQVAGNSLIAGDAGFHAFLFTAGTMLDLGTLGGSYSSANAMNNLGQVVGESDNLEGLIFPFLWQNGVVQNLNDLLPPDSGWELISALLINDAGQIVGSGYYQGEFRWFILNLATPNRPPVADAGPDQTVQCTALVALDGHRSSDPDQDYLTYEWREGDAVLAVGAAASVALPLGSHTLTLRVADPSQASAEDTLVVTVVDTITPTAVAPVPQSVAADANCQGLVPDFATGLVASDDCTPDLSLSKTQIPPAGSPVSVGIHPITLTVTDASGNAAQVTTTFTVVDAAPPVGICPAPITTSADENGKALVPDFAGLLVAQDNCTPAPNLLKAQVPAAGTSVVVGTHVITVTVTDAAGNTSACTTTFTVDDTTPPVVTCPAARTLSAGADGQVQVPDFTVGLVAGDNCTPAANLVITQEPPAGIAVGVGAYIITLTVTDAAGNSSECTTTLTVNPASSSDTKPPVIKSASVSPKVLKPVLWQMVPVTVKIVAKDNVDPAPVSRIISITSNADSQGFLPDWKITGPLTANLRAERNRHGRPRIYTLTVACTDASGNQSTTKLTVRVPGR